ncbi:acyltransferase [Amycolatopsis sp. NBRC 101858]|uniref:acyltransferase family protein n=1 Tax=Amycolatopsis sp. NBRC 101858 TaxID=3032200 RepID=UPI00249FBE0D|nr:acyltransferase [Amycolatopsis sp. NBRC 101858]GLY39673.1 acyltransferase [Amycolatopsis sp. NBRC 101858]
MPSLTGLRFIAALMVFAFHAIVLAPFASEGAQTVTNTLFGSGGFTGVTFFFILSGFVLTCAVRPRDSAPKFWRRRFFKIYPNHLITFAVALIPVTAITGTVLQGGWLNAFLLQSWSPSLEVRTSFNPVAWSLSCELLMYAAFPFIIKLVNKVRPERLWLWTLISAASVLSLPSFAKLLPAGNQFPQGFSDLELWFVFHCPAGQLLTFIFGIFMAKVVLAGRRLPLKLGGAVALTVGAYFVTPLFGPLYQFSAVMLIPLGLLIAAGARADLDRLPTFLGTRLMVWLGDISFAFYMWHHLVLVTGHNLLGQGENWSTLTSAAVLALLFAVTLLLSWVTFKFVEQPIMKRFATSRRGRGAAVITSVPTGNQVDRAA